MQDDSSVPSRGHASAQNPSPFRCDLSALTAAQRHRHSELTKQLLSAVDQTRELQNGYAFRLAKTVALTAVAE